VEVRLTMSPRGVVHDGDLGLDGHGVEEEKGREQKRRTERRMLDESRAVEKRAAREWGAGEEGVVTNERTCCIVHHLCRLVWCERRAATSLLLPPASLS
jgi:hypothetical protein